MAPNQGRRPPAIRPIGRETGITIVRQRCTFLPLRHEVALCGGGRFAWRPRPLDRIYRDGIPVAFIDWDAAQPVEPLADLAAAAWAFVPLAPPGQLAEAGFDPVPDLPAQVRMFVDAYGLTDRTAILPALRRCKLDEPEPLHWLQGIAPDLTRAL